MEEAFRQAAACAHLVPASEVLYLWDAAGTTDRSPESRARTQLVVAATRIQNPICNLPECKSKTNLRTCSRCHMTQYCSSAHQRADWAVHKKWCAQPDAERDTGPQMMVVMRKTSPEDPRNT